MQIQTHGRGVALHASRINLQCGHVLVPALRANVIHRRTTSRDQIIHPASETARSLVERSEMFDDGNLRHFIRDQKQMRKNRGIFISQPVKNFDWQLDLDGVWHVNESAGPDLGPMEGSKLCRTECSRLGHEMLAY